LTTLPSSANPRMLVIFPDTGRITTTKIAIQLSYPAVLYIQGSYRSSKSMGILEFNVEIFKALKSLENDHTLCLRKKHPIRF